MCYMFANKFFIIDGFARIRDKYGVIVSFDLNDENLFLFIFDQKKNNNKQSIVIIARAGQISLHIN